MRNSSPTVITGSSILTTATTKTLTVVEWPSWLRLLPSFSFGVIGRIHEKKETWNTDKCCCIYSSFFLLFGPPYPLVKEPLQAGERSQEEEGGGRREEGCRLLRFRRTQHVQPATPPVPGGCNVLNLRAHKAQKGSLTGGKNTPRALCDQGPEFPSL